MSVFSHLKPRWFSVDGKSWSCSASFFSHFEMALFLTVSKGWPVCDLCVKQESQGFYIFVVCNLEKLYLPIFHG